MHLLLTTTKYNDNNERKIPDNINNNIDLSISSTTNKDNTITNEYLYLYKNRSQINGFKVQKYKGS